MPADIGTASSRTQRHWLPRFALSQELVLALAILVLMVVVGVINPRFVAERNLQSIFLGNAYIAVAAIGMSMVIISGNIDISVGSLIGVLAGANPAVFHSPDGSGYRFVADWLILLDAQNPQTTARVTGVFESFRRYDPDRQALMRTELERMAAVEALSKNTREIVERILGG